MLTNVNQMVDFFNQPNEFTSAIEYTAGVTGFSTYFIEKDFLCSLILMYLYGEDNQLVFKGGTLLAKVHAGFYRLSEDLDFTIPISPHSTRKQRSQKIKPIKSILNSINDYLPFAIMGLTLQEAYAEKIRAALTRRRLAIRDFFDLDYALKNKIIDFNDAELIKVVQKKVSNEKISEKL